MVADVAEVLSLACASPYITFGDNSSIQSIAKTFFVVFLFHRVICNFQQNEWMVQ